MMCNTCKIEKDASEFSWKSEAKQIKSKKCKECHKLYMKDHYSANKKVYVDRAKKRNDVEENILRQWIVEYKSKTPCFDCDKIFPWVCMEFDHTDKILRNRVSKLIRRGKLAVKNEMAVCELVCANCHRIRTAKRANWKYADVV